MIESPMEFNAQGDYSAKFSGNMAHINTTITGMERRLGIAAEQLGQQTASVSVLEPIEMIRADRPDVFDVSAADPTISNSQAVVLTTEQEAVFTLIGRVSDAIAAAKSAEETTTDEEPAP